MQRHGNFWRALLWYLLIVPPPDVLPIIRQPAKTKLTNCRIVINEWNSGTDNPDDQFIELKAYCPKIPGLISSVDMSRYKVVVISARQDIVLVCHSTMRKRFATRRDWYFTIGGLNVVNADMNFTDCQIDSFLLQYRKSYIPTGMTFPFAIALLYNQNVGGLNQFDLENDGSDYQSRKIDDAQSLVLRNAIQDMYIFGAQTPLVTCDFFKFLLSVYIEGYYHIIRDWQIGRDNRDLSINRCSVPEESNSFKRKLMRFSSPTPNVANDCDASFTFEIENSLPRKETVAQVKISEHPFYGHCDQVTDDPDGSVTITNADIFVSQLKAAESSQISEPMEIEDGTCSVEPAWCDARGQGSELASFDFDLSTVPTLNGRFISHDCTHFPSDWIVALQVDTDRPLDVAILKDPRVCFWYEYLLQEKVGRCKLCHAIVENGLIYSRQLENIVKSGYMYRNTNSKNIKNINKNMILTHTESVIHQISEQYFSNVDQGFSGKRLEEEMLDKTKPYRMYFEATENLCISVYQSVKMGLSFHSFQVFTDTLKYFDVKIGHVHSRASGMRTMLMHIEKMMRQDLVTFLLKTRPEISVTLDASTDIAGLPSLAVLFQTFVEKNNIKIFFYRLLPLSGDSGVSLFTTFHAALVEDGLEEYMKSKLTGFVSDGCSVMTSTFMRELQKFTESGFINSWCMNHRLNLVSKNSLTQFPMIKAIEAKVNQIAKFFGPISPKKRRILHASGAEYGFRPFEVHRIHDIRWSQSKNKALRSVIYHWPAIVDALEKISLSNDFKGESKRGAEDLLKPFKDGTFLSSMAFLQDVTDFMAEITLTLQERGNTLIGKRVLMDALKLKLLDLKSEYGETLSSLLQNTRIQEKNIRRAPSLLEFESKSVAYKGKVLQPSGLYNDTVLLNTNIETYVNSIVDKFDQYFPSTDVSDFDLFNPPELSVQSATDEPVKEQLTAMNEKYKWNYDPDVLNRDWNALVQGIVRHSDYLQSSIQRPEEFWKHFLNFEDDEVGWTDNTRTLVRRVLSVGSSSSEAERVFSVASAQKSKRRYNLKVETVNALVAIRINGVKDIRKIDTYKYAKEFTRLHSRADDPSRHGSMDVVDDEDFFLAPFEQLPDEA